METVGYIINIIAFIWMVGYIKSIRYKKAEDEEWRTIKLTILSWLVFVTLNVVPYIGAVVFWVAGEFLVQDITGHQHYSYNETHQTIRKIYSQTIGNLFNKINIFLSKEI